MPTSWAGYRAAKLKAREHVAEARDCMARYRNTGDPIYLDLARIHVQTARNFNRNAWRGPKL